MTPFPNLIMRRRLVSILMTLSVLFLAPPASAINVWLSDESGFDFHDGPYATNEVIYISGEWDHFTFPCAVGDIYLISNDGAFWPTRAIGDRSVTRKTVQGCAGAGAFYGQILKLPPLPPGEYDILMDEDEDGTYDAGIDYILGDGPGAALKVIDQTLDQQVDVAAIKTSAASSAVHWYEVKAWSEFGFAVLGIASTVTTTIQLATVYGSNLLTVGYAVFATGAEIKGVPISYEGVSMFQLSRVVSTTAQTSANVYEDIANDPPDPNYTVPVELAGITYKEPLSSEPLENWSAQLQNTLSEQASIGEAFRRSYEKFLGAELAENYPHTLVQVRAAREYCGLLLETLPLCIAHLDSLEGAIDDTGWADSVFSGSVARDIQDRVETTGLTPSERAGMTDVGMTAADIDSVEAAIITLPLTDLEDTSLRELVSEPRAEVLAAIAHYGLLAGQLDSILTALENGWTSHPSAVISGDTVVPEGSSLSLNGHDSIDPQGGSLTMQWDLDLDGAFDDGVGAGVSFAPSRSGDYLVGLRVTNAGGQSDVAYHRARVLEVNRMPVFTTWSPDSVFVRSPVGSPRHFEVQAMDPDDDDLAYEWTVDGVAVGLMSSYDFVGNSPGIYDVAVRLMDGSPQSLDPLRTWRVRVEAGSVGVEILPGPPPARFEVHPGSPNPFRSKVVSIIDIDRTTRVEIAIYTITGRLVMRLTDRVLDTGRYEITWDGRFGSGVEAAPGVYFLSVDAGFRRATTKLVRVR